MTDIQSRIRNYLDSRKPKTVLSTPNIISKTELEDSVDEFKQAWDDLLDPFMPLIKLIKLAIYGLIFIVVVGAFIVVHMQNRCYLDNRCRIEMERLER